MAKVYTDGNQYLLLLGPSKCGSTSSQQAFHINAQVHDFLGDPTLLEVNQQLAHLRKEIPLNGSHIDWTRKYIERYQPDVGARKNLSSTKQWAQYDYRIDIISSVIRNPFYRMVSIWSYLKKKGASQHGCPILYSKACENTFEEFVKFFMSNAKQPTDEDVTKEINSFKPQIEYLVDETNKCKVNFLLSCDDMERDINNMSKSIGWKTDIGKPPMLNQSDWHGGSISSMAKNAEELYSTKSRKLVHEYEKGLIEFKNTFSIK